MEEVDWRDILLYLLFSMKRLNNKEYLMINYDYLESLQETRNINHYENYEYERIIKNRELEMYRIEVLNGIYYFIDNYTTKNYIIIRDDEKYVENIEEWTMRSIRKKIKRFGKIKEVKGDDRTYFFYPVKEIYEVCKEGKIYFDNERFISIYCKFEALWVSEKEFNKWLEWMIFKRYRIVEKNSV